MMQEEVLRPHYEGEAELFTENPEPEEVLINSAVSDDVVKDYLKQIGKTSLLTC